MKDNGAIRFVPSRVEGTSPVDEVAVHPNRLELVRQAERAVIRYVDIARWPRPRLFWNLAFLIGCKLRWLPVADRDFQRPGERFFRFYTNPPIVIFMPHDEKPGPYPQTWFFRIRQTIETGGFHTFDLS
jgi:hypothetical protein